MARHWTVREGHYGELNGNNVWTDAQAKMIREYREDGFSIHDLRKLWGGSDAAIVDLCNGKTYKTAGGPISGVDYPRRKYTKSILKDLHAPVLARSSKPVVHNRMMQVRILSGVRMKSIPISNEDAELLDGEPVPLTILIPVEIEETDGR